MSAGLVIGVERPCDLFIICKTMHYNSLSLVLRTLLVVAPGGATPGNGGTPVTPVAILREAIAAADAAPRKDFLLREIAVTLANAGHTDEALRLADGDQQTTQSVLQGAAFARARSGDTEEALRTARRLGAPATSQGIAIIAAIRAFSGDGVGARKIVEDELKDESERSQAAKRVALALEEAGDFDEAARSFEAIPSLWEKALSLPTSFVQYGWYILASSASFLLQWPKLSADGNQGSRGR